MIVAGVLGGMAWAAIPAFLRTRFNASEILTSLMLTYVAQQILIYLVTGPWKDPEGYGFPQSRLFSEWATLPILVPAGQDDGGLPAQGGGAGAARRALCRLQPDRADLVGALDRRRRRRPRRA